MTTLPMKIIYNKIFLSHDTGVHPENAQRILACGNLPEMNIENGEQYLPLVHTTEYIKHLKSLADIGGRLDQDTVMSKDSYQTAVFAVGASVMASEQNDFAFVRPPGHHAHRDKAEGFCLFNNIAIAVQRLVNLGKRIVIIDLDSHLGDGTMEFFYNTDKVLYCSLHQDPAFPGGGSVDQIGDHDGKGYTVNIPLSPESGDDIYMRGFNFILEISKLFKPDIVGVSAGFDGHTLDPLLQLRLSENTYYQTGKILGQTFPNLFATLEGGYNPEVFPKCLFNFIHGVNQEPQEFTEDPTDSGILLLEDFDLRLDKLKSNLKPYWQI